MNTNNRIYLKALSLFLFMTIFYVVGTKAQNTDKVHVSALWQFNAPAGNKFSNIASGWGMGLEGTYRFSDNIEGGLFFDWHTNNKYIPRKTYEHGTSAINMDQQRSLFQMPFGAMVNYIFVTGVVEPYVGLKIGANYAKQTTDSNIYEFEKNNWGVFASPEIGATYYPTSNHNIGIKLAGYYGYASNRYKTFHMNNINNIGFRLGVILEL